MTLRTSGHHTVTTVHAHPVTGSPMPCLVIHPDHPLHYGSTRSIIRGCGLAPVGEGHELDDHDAVVRIAEPVAEVVGGGVVRHRAVVPPGWADLAVDRGVLLLTVGLDHPHDTRIADGRRGLGAWLRGAGQCFVGVVPVVATSGEVARS